MKYIVFNKINNDVIKKWDNFINTHKYGTVFQSYRMWELFKQTDLFEPVFYYCLNRTNDLVGILLGAVIRESKGLKGFISSRTVVYGGPLIDQSIRDSNEVLELLLNFFVHDVKKRSMFIQFRNFFDLSGVKNVFRDFGFKLHPRLNLLIDTTEQQKVWRGISESRRRQIKKSLRNGARIIEPDDIKQLRIFYNILNDLYQNKVKKPLPGWSFFKNFYTIFHKQNSGKIFLIEYEGKIIGGILSPLLEGQSLYEWYVCGLDKEFKEKGIFPSALVTWAAIEYAAKNNFCTFDFMGVGKPGVKYGVREFKSRFGGKTVNYGRYIRINNQLLYRMAEMGYNILAHLKKI